MVTALRYFGRHYIFTLFVFGVLLFYITSWSANAEVISFVSPGEGVEATVSKPPIIFEVDIPVSDQNQIMLGPCVLMVIQVFIITEQFMNMSGLSIK